MKHLKIIFRTILLLSTLLPTTLEAKDNKEMNVEYFDSVEVSLLTCQPHDEIYSLYGHTALRWHDLHKGGGDIAFNWGVFNFDAPYFVARFVFGLTDYELGGYPYSLFQQEYRRFGSMVTEQMLNLTPQEKRNLWKALDDNLLPQNRIYRYNYFYNNCTTKARDIIERCIEGKVMYNEQENDGSSYREMVHEMTTDNPWARFGNDLLLGIKADMKTSRQEQEFLPNNLMHDFDHAQIYQDNGEYRPLVSERRTSVPAGIQMKSASFPLTPYIVGLLLLLTGVILFILEWNKKRAFLWWDLMLMTTTGIIGIVLFLMLFSQHPTVSLNLQFILLNPLPWFFMWSVMKGRDKRYWQITLGLAVLFLAGSMMQTYAEGIRSLAWCLLMQCYIHLRIIHRHQ